MNDPEIRKRITEGFKALVHEMGYNQMDIVRKLNQINCKVGRASFNNALNDKRVGRRTLLQIMEGIEKLVSLELGMEWNDKKQVYQKLNKPGFTPTIVKPPEANIIKSNSGIDFHAEGRVTIAHKVAFMEEAQQEIIELGLRLNTFITSFTSLRENEFMAPIRRILSRGVNMKLYLIDPDSNEASFYFNDRAKEQEDELQGTESIKKVLRKFPKIIEELYDQNYKGKFEVFLYKNLPYNNFLIIDPESITGKMMVSHYLYGIRRADCPVIEFSKRNNRGLFRKYFSSFNSMTKAAKKYKFEK